MLNTFKYTIIALVKEKNVFFWALIFPAVLATLFSIMFADMDESLSFRPIATSVVEDTNYASATAEPFREMLKALAATGDGQMLELYPVKNLDEAKQLLNDGTVVGFFLLDNKATPELYITSPRMFTDSDSINQTILKNIVDNYIRAQQSINTIAKENPLVLSDPRVLEILSSRTSYTEEINLLANKASGSVRYFYALLGFLSVIAGMVGLIAVSRTQANLSALGARRTCGATSKTKTLAATLLASWLLAFSCMTLAFCYMRFVLGIGFDRELACVLGIAVASLMSTSLGACIGSIPKLNEQAKAGIVSGLSCFLGLFSGLYGEPSMKLADSLARSAPLLQTVNPSRQVTDLFYSLYFYDGYDHFFQAILVLLITSVVLFVISTFFLRRHRYASL